MTTIILVALLGVVVSILVGSFWYAPSTPMGKLHMRFVGMEGLSPEERARKMDEVKPMMPKQYFGQALLSLLTSFAVVFIITMSVRNGVTFMMALGFVVLNWLCFMVPIIGSSILWSNCDRALAWPKFFSDALANLVTVLLIAFLASLFL